jgi:16S rRNA G527 N7-methylase RsmG
VTAAVDRLAALARREGLPFDQSWLPAIEGLLALLFRFNRRTNLVGDAAPDTVVDDHLVEALVAVQVVDQILSTPPRRVIDVGAGAGLESLIMALAWPQSQVLAVEPRRRRADFIELAADAAGTGRRVQVLRQDLASLRIEPADVATSRAVFEPARWLTAGRPLVVAGGVLLLHGDARAAPGPADQRGKPWPAGPSIRVPGSADHHVRSWRRPTRRNGESTPTDGRADNG